MENMQGMIVVVTGASSGIGAAGARALANAGATVAVVGRDKDRTNQVAQECLGKGRAFVADMSSLASVVALAHELAEAYPVIDVLANNAGFIAAKDEKTVDGIESTFAVNHVAPFLLTRLLEPNLQASVQARVITTSSSAHNTGKLDRPFDSGAKWSSWGAYGDSKLANIAFTAELDRRMQGTNVSANCFHPGVVHTGFGRDKGMLSLLQNTLGRYFLITAEKGADTLVYLASDPEATKTTGKFWVKRKVAKPSAEGSDSAGAKVLWDKTEALIAPFTK
jgi:NAD(P)-dependent dehydrogenase (short-subunit alcohol dehydrogenase family)